MSILQQNNTSWECFILNNSIKNIEQYIINDKRFTIINTDTALDTIIQKAKGKYISFINASDILIVDTVDNILYTTDLTDSDIIKTPSELLSRAKSYDPDRKCKFKYIFNKNEITQYIFDDLSEFCFKKEILLKTATGQSCRALLTNALLNAKDMTTIENTCILKQRQPEVSVNDIIETYTNNKEKLSQNFWRKYFKQITPTLIANMAKTNNKVDFLKFCRQIPLSLIPLRYRIMCYILKKTNK